MQRQRGVSGEISGGHCQGAGWAVAVGWGGRDSRLHSSTAEEREKKAKTQALRGQKEEREERRTTRTWEGEKLRGDLRGEHSAF